MPERLRLSAASVPVDLSFLNEKPAGLRGPVRADGADLVFADGTPVRFWGANVQAYALFATDPADICFHARRLSALGFNLVRLHHHDSSWVNPNVFGPRAKNTLTPDPASLSRIGKWVSCLKAEGIYTWLDLHVGRRMSAADGIDFADEVATRNGDIRGFNFVNNSIRDRMAEFQSAYLSFVNPHTGLAFTDDPAIAAVMISNENDVTYHFGNALLPDKDVPQHSALYMALADEFARTHGLSRRQVWRSWEHGPSKIFLNDLEQRFFAPMIADIRRLGFRGLIATSGIWGGNGAAALPSLMLGDLIDVHSYGGPGMARTDPATTADMISVVAGAQVAGKPLSISEWNVTPWPESDRFIAPLRMGAAAAHQGWDAPIIYGYAQNPLGRGPVANNWHIEEDASLIGPLAVAALLYRRGDVAGAERVVAMAPDADTLFGKHLHAPGSPAIRALTERSRLVTQLPPVPELPWLRPTREEADETYRDYGNVPAGAGGRNMVSDTGEIRRDPKAGVIRIETGRSLVIAGHLGAKEHAAGALTVTLDQALAGVAVQSLDGRDIPASDDLLITLMGPSVPVADERPPFLVGRMSGTVEFAAGPDLVPVGIETGTGPGRVAHEVRGAYHRLSFNQAPAISWIRLKAPD